MAARSSTATRPSWISQRERPRQAAERKLLDATAAILIERGYAATTTLEVQKQAGVSRKVLLHYFGSRGEPISAAARHLYVPKVGEVRLRVTQTPDGEDWVSLLWQVVSGPLGGASLELLIAARHDPDMREYLKPLERELRARTSTVQGAAGRAARRPQTVRRILHGGDRFDARSRGEQTGPWQRGGEAAARSVAADSRPLLRPGDKRQVTVVSGTGPP